jgi:hypothetical protein
MQVKLIVVEGPARQREVVLDLPAVIGRSRAAGLTIGDPKVSRQHCFLEEHGGMVMLRDNGSLNGTILDGERVAGEAIIRPGAKLSVGPLTFVVVYEPAGEEAQFDTGQMSKSGGAPDFEALVAGASDDEEAAEEAFEDDEGDDSPDFGDVTIDDATAQWLPPTADGGPAAPLPPSAFAPPDARSAAPTNVPPTASGPGKAPSTPPGAKPTPTAKPAIPQSPAAVPPGDFSWLTEEPGEFDDDARPPDEAEPPKNPPPADDSQEDESQSPEAASADSEDPLDCVDEDDEGKPAEPASQAASAKGKTTPKKKRSWWPFGKKKGKDKPQAADEAKTAGEPAPSAEETEPETDEEPAESTVGEQPAQSSGNQDGITIGLPPTAESTEQKPIAPAPPPSDAEDDDDEDDDALGHFLKGIGK